MPADTLPVLSVSHLSNLIKETLEGGFYSLHVEGEVVNFKPSSTGHWYFSLKDDKASIKAVLFKQRHYAGMPKPADGMKVRVTGSLSVYTPRGEYQIIVEKIDVSGEGDILLLLEKRKQKLAAEGLFDSERKRRLPLLPSCVGIVTSPTGAALQDIMRVLKRRHAGLHIRIFPAVVQGESAAAEIAKMVTLAGTHGLCDVLIVGRGGGSMEDLLPFSDEAVVRAVAACAVPVISAVGHEIDTPLCDYAADLRAPTPSAAAELVCASREEILNRISNARDFIENQMGNRLQRTKDILKSFRPDELKERFYSFLHPVEQKLDDLKEDLLLNMRSTLALWLSKIRVLGAGIEAANPRFLQDRGWVYLTDPSGQKILSRNKKIKSGDEVLIHFTDGIREAAIKESKS
jgi:exodeoxyribonuclease VII large subunit